VLLSALAVSMFIAGGAAAAAPPKIDESELLSSGFQRSGKKFFIYPDSARKQIYVGGPREYDAYLQLHPDSKLATREAVKKGTEYRGKSYEETRKATARDLTDPFLGADWVYFGF
jgi:predicted AlkP superfamily phosphohydrolase/phosphomutase